MYEPTSTKSPPAAENSPHELQLEVVEQAVVVIPLQRLAQFELDAKARTDSDDLTALLRNGSKGPQATLATKLHAPQDRVDRSVERGGAEPTMSVHAVRYPFRRAKISRPTGRFAARPAGMFESTISHPSASRTRKTDVPLTTCTASKSTW